MSNGAGDGVALRDRLVAALEAAGTITSPQVGRAFRAVPRHLFVPHVPLSTAYDDDVIFTKARDGVSLSACSSPSIVAEMLELLDARPGHRVLEVGAGTGYNAALLAELVGPAGRVVTLDIDQDIVDAAAANLREAGRGTGIAVRRGDGGFGWPEESPYDRIVVTAGAWDVPPAWFEQLADGGLLVVPLEFRDVHKLVAFERLPDRLASTHVRDCRFVQLRGAFAGPERQLPLASDGLYLSTIREQVDPERLAAALLAGAGPGEPLPVPLSPEELYGAFRLWLALRTDDFCLLSLEGRALRRSRVRAWHTTPARTVRAPDGSTRFASVPGLLEREAVCLLERDDDDSRPVIRGYGGAAGLARRLRSYLEEWSDAGRPFSSGLSIEAAPLDAPDGPAQAASGTAGPAAGWTVRKRWFRYVLRPGAG